MAPNNRPERWHVGKEIPIALIVMLILQTGGWVWWAAVQSTKLDNLTSMMSDFRASQYTSADARRDAEGHALIHSELARRIGVLEAQLLYRDRTKEVGQ